MAFFRKKSVPTQGRQRLLHEQPSKAPAAFSYRAVRSEQELNTGRQLERTPPGAAARKVGRFWLQRFGLGILLVVAAVCLVSVLDLSTSPKVEILSGSGGTPFVRSASVYQKAAAKLFAASIWNHNKLTVDTGKVTNELKAEFPEIADVSITLPFVAHRPVVYIQPAEPALILASSNGSYVLDTSGKALASVDQASMFGPLHLPTVTDQSGLTVELDRQAMASSSVTFIQTVITEVEAWGFQVSSLTLPPAADELDMRLGGQPYFVKFNLQNNDPRQQAGTFLAVQNTLKSQNVTPAQYIDVRVDGRAYYK